MGSCPGELCPRCPAGDRALGRRQAELLGPRPPNRVRIDQHVFIGVLFGNHSDHVKMAHDLVCATLRLRFAISAFYSSPI